MVKFSKRDIFKSCILDVITFVKLNILISIRFKKPNLFAGKFAYKTPEELGIIYDNTSSLRYKEHIFTLSSSSIITGHWSCLQRKKYKYEFVELNQMINL